MNILNNLKNKWNLVITKTYFLLFQNIKINIHNNYNLNKITYFFIYFNIIP